MIEPSRKLFALVDGQIKLELVARARRRIGPRGVRHHHRAGTTQVDAALPSRHDTRGAVEEPRKLSERDRPLVVEVANRATFMQEPCGRRNDLRTCRGKSTKVDLL